MRTFNILAFLALLVCFGTAIVAHGAEISDEAAAAEIRQEIDAILDQPQIALSDLFRLAELTNPQLAVARTRVQAQTGRVQQAGLYPNPELVLDVEELLLNAPSVYKWRVGLMQPLIIGGRRGAAVDAARATLEAADYQLRQARREALRRVHQLWAEQLFFREAEAVFAELLTVANNTLAIARTRFDARAAPESQVTKALLEVYELEVAEQRLAQDRVRIAAQFAAFFGEVPVPLDRLAGSLDPDSTEVLRPPDLAQGLGDHPAVWATKLNIAAAEAALREAKAQRIPDLRLFFAYGNFEPIGENYIEAGIALPVPLFDRNQGRVAESQSLITQAQYQNRIVENNLEVALAAARQRHQMMHEQLTAVTGRIVPAAERGLDQAQEAYRVGRLMFLELVDAQRTFADVRLRTLELRRDLALAEADLMSLVGTGLYADPGDER